GDERTAIDVVGVQRLDAHDLTLDDLGDQFSGKLGIALDKDLAGSRVHDSLGGGAADDVVEGNLELLGAGLLKLVDMPCGNPTALLNDDLAFLILDVQRCDLA